MGLITNQQITTILVITKTLDVCPNGFIATNKDIEHFCSNKQIHGLLHSFSIRFCQCQCLDHSRTEPLDKLIVPILHQGTRTYHNYPLGSRFFIRLDTGFQQGINKSHRLQSLPKSHVICQNTAIPLKVSNSHDALIHEQNSFPLVRSEPFGENGRNVLIFIAKGLDGWSTFDGNFFFHTIFIRLHFTCQMPGQPNTFSSIVRTLPNHERLKLHLLNRRTFRFCFIVCINILILLISSSISILRQSITKSLPRSSQQFTHPIHSTLWP
mmetsp:Transcript_7135/g.13521  ORF Transcript_7135/g.13521 Transcript_7135/m.13521 type:complete len:268 (+) Transcript_7135:2527-3330(+)